MKRIGIIGAGLAGLTCAYKLSGKGKEVIVIEKDSMVGGRIQYAAAIGSEKFQKNITGLIRELGIEVMKNTLNQNQIAFFGEDFLALEDFPKVLQESLNKAEMEDFMEFSKFVNALDFDPFNPSQELLRIRDISLAEYGKKFSENVKAMAFAGAKILSEKDDMNKISADYGLHLIRMGNEVMSGEAIYFEELNLMSLTNILAEKIEKAGGKIVYGSEVRAVEKKKDGFEIHYESLRKKNKKKVDVVIFAIPLVEISSIFPALKLKSNVEYPKNKIIIVGGTLKYPERKLIMGLPGNPYNLRLFLNFISTEQYFLPWDREKEIDLGFLYEDYNIVLEKEIYPLPVIPPKPRVPELKTELEEVYLVGDFYYYPYDTSAYTANVVAKMIAG